MSGALDMALDDVISQNRKQRGSNRGNNTRRGGMNRSRPTQGRSMPYNRPSRVDAPVRPVASNSLVVSNLHFNVTEKDLYDLFGQIGPLNRAFLHIGPNGKSAGIADVVFKNSNDAERARTTYNNVELDGRPMRITTATTTVPSLTNRLSMPSGGNNRRNNNVRGNNRRAPGGGGRRRENRPKPSEEDLDADMDSYMGSADN